MSASSLLSGTPAALSVDIDITNLNANTASISGSATIGGTLDVAGAVALDSSLSVAGAVVLDSSLSVADAITTQNDVVLTNAAGAVGCAIAGAASGAGLPPRGVITLAAIDGAVAGDSFGLVAQQANNFAIERITAGPVFTTVIGIDDTNITTIGDGVAALPLKVSGAAGVGDVYDTVNNPPIVEFYAPPLPALPNMPSWGTPNETLLNIAIPPSAQNSDYFIVDFLFNGTQTVGGAGTPQNWRLYLTEQALGAYDAAKSGSLEISATANITWTGATYAGQSANPATISGGRLQLWYRAAEPPAGPITNLYLTVSATSVSTVGGTLNAPFALDAIVTPFNLD